MPDSKIQPINADADVPEVSELKEALSNFERFVARRFDELSMEINATSQQVDMAEEEIGKRFSQIFEVLGAVAYKGDGLTAANAGVELDAVVDMTEEAANSILDAAGKITEAASDNGAWETEEGRQEALAKIMKQTEEIFMACSFQDITGQRIRKALENLQTIEDQLLDAIDQLGIQYTPTTSERIVQENMASSQDDIDALFGDAKKSQE